MSLDERKPVPFWGFIVGNGEVRLEGLYRDRREHTEETVVTDTYPHFSPSSSCSHATQPIFTRVDTKTAFQWRIRNLPYPIETYL